MIGTFIEVWKRLKEKNVRLTTRHYETYLNGLNENGFLFDSDYYLNLLHTGQIQATPRLYGLLLNQFVFLSFSTTNKHFLLSIDFLVKVKLIV